MAGILLQAGCCCGQVVIKLTPCTYSPAKPIIYVLPGSHLADFQNADDLNRVVKMSNGLCYYVEVIPFDNQTLSTVTYVATYTSCANCINAPCPCVNCLDIHTASNAVIAVGGHTGEGCCWEGEVTSLPASDAPASQSIAFIRDAMSDEQWLARVGFIPSCWMVYGNTLGSPAQCDPNAAGITLAAAVISDCTGEHCAALGQATGDNLIAAVMFGTDYGYGVPTWTATPNLRCVNGVLQGYCTLPACRVGSQDDSHCLDWEMTVTIG